MAGVSGYVTFQMAARELAGRLTEVHEVVRATGIETLPGARAPVTGLLMLRGNPVPVVDVRTAADPADTGDVLVLDTSQGTLGLAVDRVLAVLGPEELVPTEGRPSESLPSYVLEVRRDAAGAPVFVVSLAALAGLDTAAFPP
jgi:purine-binding chemotaxis protein CheW